MEAAGRHVLLTAVYVAHHYRVGVLYIPEPTADPIRHEVIVSEFLADNRSRNIAKVVIANSTSLKFTAYSNLICKILPYSLIYNY